MKIEALYQPVAESDVTDLIDLLQACVGAGASIGFLAPLPSEEAKAYWKKVLTEAGEGRAVFVYRDAAGKIVGSAQIAFESKANGRHRAEVQKVMVRPGQRRKGIASDLMREIESAARARKRSLLFLDTSHSHSGAVEFYRRLGYEYVGGIPDYAADPFGKLEPNAIFYKRLN